MSSTKTEISLPAEMWKVMADTYSAMAASEQSPGKLVGVKSAIYSGQRYTCFGVMYGPYRKKGGSRVWAYRLVPESMYGGETTTVYHDEDAIKAGLRGRGDCTGLIVSVSGKRMVCAERVDFLIAPPTTKPVPLADAQAFNEKEQGYGYRSFRFSGQTPEWKYLNGHPVAVYKSDGEEMHAVLIWKKGKNIEEMWLGEVELYASSTVGVIASIRSEDQLSLF